AARTGRLGADDLGAIVDVIEPIALDDGAGADTFIGPVVDAAGRQLIVDRLPEELAGRLIKAHQHAFVALACGVAGLALGGARGPRSGRRALCCPDLRSI